MWNELCLLVACPKGHLGGGYQREVHLRKGAALPSCTAHTCNPLELTITSPLDPRWSSGEVVTLGIDGTGLNLCVEIRIRIRGQVLAPSAQVY